MSILEHIVARKKEEIAAAKKALPADVLRSQILRAPKPRGFRKALESASGIAVIAEVKRRSPSRGILRENFDPVSIAKSYEANGASALSVLTDADFFGGSLAHLEAVHEAVRLPILRKDFTLEEYQLLEARAAGADAVLLIAAILEADAIRALKAAAEALGLDALIEIHSAADSAKISGIGPSLVGINNRDLATFTVSLEVTEALVAGIPAGSTVVAESGIHTPADIARLAACGVKAVLVGETLITKSDPGAALKKLLTPSS